MRLVRPLLVARMGSSHQNPLLDRYMVPVFAAVVRSAVVRSVVVRSVVVLLVAVVHYPIL